MWDHTDDEVRKHVAATKTDTVYRKQREDEGWLPEEIRPLYVVASTSHPQLLQ